jgi:photosystem II protein
MLNQMNPKIFFIENLEEKTIPLIELTKSKNGKTGTATFIFIQPDIFSQTIYPFPIINGMFLMWEGKKISGNDIKIIFKDGEPFLIRSILLFKNSQEWFDFLNFMNAYSKDRDLIFSDTYSFSSYL